MTHGRYERLRRKFRPANGETGPGFHFATQNTARKERSLARWPGQACLNACLHACPYTCRAPGPSGEPRHRYHRAALVAPGSIGFCCFRPVIYKPVAPEATGCYQIILSVIGRPHLYALYRGQALPHDSSGAMLLERELGSAMQLAPKAHSFAELLRAYDRAELLASVAPNRLVDRTFGTHGCTETRRFEGLEGTRQSDRQPQRISEHSALGPSRMHAMSCERRESAWRKSDSVVEVRRWLRCNTATYQWPVGLR